MDGRGEAPPGHIRPLPVPTELSQPFWSGCADHELRYQRCRSCDVAVFPPEAVCPTCLYQELEWRVGEGRGTVYSVTIAHSPPTPGFPVPSAVAIVELAEGYSMFSNIVGCPVDEVRIGLPVVVTFERMRDQVTLPFFRPA